MNKLSLGDRIIECKTNGIRRFDVGVDANSFYPISITKIIDFMYML